jgi:hypothetical protein
MEVEEPVIDFEEDRERPLQREFLLLGIAVLGMLLVVQVDERLF